tara:strand:- start:1905 stop:2624 length:720 start_codon:yes stop_codon:yes gene_type:complete
MVRANFPNILFGNQVQAAAGGGAPATPVIYSNLAGFLATPTRFVNLVEMASETGPLWSAAYGVSDIATGTGVYGIGNNYGGNNGNAVPPDPQRTTFGLGMQNLSGLVNYDVDTADYMVNYTGAGIYPPGWEDYLNFGAYADDPGAGGASAATSWSWDVTILAQSFSGGAVAVTSGTGVTTQNADFALYPGTGVGEDVKWSLGRGGSIIAGDNINIEVAVTASNGSGSAVQAVNITITWI